MGLKKLVLTSMLTILNVVCRLLPIKKNRITFISLTADCLEQDFYEIDKELKKLGEYEIHYNLIVFKKTLKDDFLYMLNCIRQLYEINTSKLIILNDNNFVVTKFKRKNTYVIQTWHACGAIKKFGNQIERQYPIKNYDLILSNSVYWKNAYSEAFGVEKEQVCVTGMPRVDKLCKSEVVEHYRKLFDAKYPHLKNHYKVLYAPTFRGNIIKGLRPDYFDMKKMLEALPNDYVFLYKMHPLLQDVNLCEGENILNVSHDDLYTLLCACDCLITDYSSILFDYSLLQKKAICYASDLEEYEKTIGFNVDYLHEMPQDICYTEDEVLAQLNALDYPKDRLRNFQQKFMPYNDGENAKRVLKEITNFMDHA